MSTGWYAGAICYAAYVAAAWLFLRWQRHKSTREEALCGECGYPRRGLPGPICPECGSDVNVVGIRRPTWWNCLSPVARGFSLLIGWTVAIAGAAGLSWDAYREFVEPGVSVRYEVIGATSLSGGFELGVRRECAERDWGIRSDHRQSLLHAPEHVTATVGVWGNIWHGDLREELHFVVEERETHRAFSLGCYPCPPASVPPDVTSRTHDDAHGDWQLALNRWLEAVGERYQCPAVCTEVPPVMHGLLQAPYTPFPNPLTSSFRNAGYVWWRRWHPDRLYRALLVTVWLAIWLVPVRRIVLREKRGHL
jgi:hypothetical protein